MAFTGASEILKNIQGIYTEVNFKELYKNCALVHELDHYLLKFGYENFASVKHLFGNVSEFTALKGVNKGGSYYHSAKLAATNQFQNGEEPKPWLGFRVVAELVYIE